MKKILLFSLLLCLGFTTAFAQAPPFYNQQSLGGGNAIPFAWNSSTKVQWIFGPGAFSSGGGGVGTPAFIGLIDTIWIGTNGPTAAFTSGFEISVGQGVGTQATWTSGTYITGLTTIVGPQAMNFATQANTTITNWVGIAVATPFLYNPALSLVVQGQHPATMTTAASMYHNYGTGSKRIYSAFGLASGTAGTGEPAIGLSLASPLPCATPTNLTATAITQTSANLGWTDNNTSAPTGGWDIEYGATNFIPTGNPTVNSATNPYPLTTLTQNSTYDFYVRAHCGPGDSSYWNGPFTFTTLATCPWPTGLNATNVVATGADLNWTENGTATTWEIELIPAGGTFTGSPNLPTVTTPSPYFQALPSNTCFEYKVRSICGPMDSSSWSPTGAFCTPCVAATTPYCFNFDTVTSTGSGNQPLFISCWDNFSTISTATTDRWACNVSGGAGPAYGVAGAVDHTSGTGRYAWVDFLRYCSSRWRCCIGNSTN